MKNFALLIVLAIPLSGCATAMVTGAVAGAVVGTATTATKVAVKTGVGAGKLAYRGTKAVAKGTASLVSSDDDASADD